MSHETTQAEVTPNPEAAIATARQMGEDFKRLSMAHQIPAGAVSMCKTPWNTYAMLASGDP